ncbi:LysM domain-containing protein [Mesorhizobium sp. CAU 1741]|uniref:LysM peptidoglycan-binding domain-containing protein n=1 Tax=Mesorhizobium sp. CAU 1741 TaxID=3140366 RepID=UPI00325AD72B
MFTHLLLLSCVTALVAFSGAAHAACPDRIIIQRGDTLSSIARACGVNVPALRGHNPGLIPDAMQPGTTVRVPRPALPTPLERIGRPSIQVMPSRVPSPSVPSGSTVILAPPPRPVPQQHILRGFGDKPGQIPLPPGHSSPFP